MKSIYIKLVCLLFFGTVFLPDVSAGVKDYPKSIEETTVLDCIGQEPISAASFSGCIRLKSPEAVVRVILTDAKGNRYLMSEVVAQYSASTDTTVVEGAIETLAFKEDVVPASIKVAIHDAEVEIKDIVLSSEKMDEAQRDMLLKRQAKLHAAREQGIVNQINARNEAKNIYWHAQKNCWSEMTFEAKQRGLGIPDEAPTWGYEYYGGGIIILGATDYASLPHNAPGSAFATECDWRNRHGKNWMTPNRRQISSSGNYNSSACDWAFAPVGAAEARVNLYYNRSINLDLSEEYVIAYSGGRTDATNYYGPGNPTIASNFIVSNGLPRESSCPFGGNWIDNHPTPNLNSVASFNGYQRFSASTFCADTLKKHIINDGPLVGSFILYHSNSTDYGIDMTLAGYKVVEEGDTIIDNSTDQFVVQSGSNLIGATYWIFKSTIPSGTPILDNGYLYVVANNISDIIKSNRMGYFTGSVQALNYTNSYILVEDADGDGYYNWGIGPKPASLPSWVPDQRDGDDSDSSVGPMNGFGVSTPLYTALNDTIYITTNQTLSSDMYLRNQVVVRNGATLTVRCRVDMHPDVKVYVENGGKVVVDGGFVNNASVELQNGSSFEITNGGRIVPNGNFTVPTGVNFVMGEGKIEP